MPTTRKQKKARKSRGQEMLYGRKNLDIMQGRSHFDRDESEDGILARKPRSVNDDVSDNNEESPHSNTRESRSGKNADLGQNSTGASSNAEINRLSGELNSRISREMDEMLSSVSVQIQRAFSDAINDQVLPQIHNVLKAGSGQTTQNGRNVRAERPEYIAEDYRNEKIRNYSRSEFSRNRLQDENRDQAYDNIAHSASMCRFGRT